ncbi:hypothetical protein ACOMHN_014937 [Nucella lapillus]
MNNTTVDAHAKLVEANDEIARDLIPAMVYLAVLMLLGIVGNILVCFVFFFRLRMTTQDFLIIALAVFDLLSCFIAMPTEIVDMRYFLMFDNEFACRLLRFIIHYCAFASILTLVVIALDRYMKVCHPLQRQMSLKKVKVALLFVLLVALVFAAPATILYGVRTTDVDGVSIPGHDCSTNDGMKGTVFPLVFNIVLFVAFFLILVMLSVIYIRIWREMKRHRIYMARNSLPGDGRLYFSTLSEASSACEIPRRRLTLPAEDGSESVSEGSGGKKSRGKKEKRGERGCNGGGLQPTSVRGDTLREQQSEGGTSCADHGLSDTNTQHSAHMGDRGTSQAQRGLSAQHSARMGDRGTSHAQCGLSAQHSAHMSGADNGHVQYGLSATDSQDSAHKDKQFEIAPAHQRNLHPNVTAKTSSPISVQTDTQSDSAEIAPVPQRNFPTNVTAKAGSPVSTHREERSQNEDIPIHDPASTQTSAIAATDSAEVRCQDVSCGGADPRNVQTSNGPLPPGFPSEGIGPLPSELPSPSEGIDYVLEATDGVLAPPDSCAKSCLSSTERGMCQSNFKDTALGCADHTPQNCGKDSAEDNTDSKAEWIALNAVRRKDLSGSAEEASIAKHHSAGEGNKPDCGVTSDPDRKVSASFCQSLNRTGTLPASEPTQPPPSQTAENVHIPTPLPNHQTDVRTTSHCEDGVTNGDVTSPEPESDHPRTTTSHGDVTNSDVTSRRSSEPETSERLRKAEAITVTRADRKVVRKKSGHESKRHKATVIATSVTVVFFLSFLPHLSLITVRILDPRFDRNLTGAGLVLYNVFLRSYFINAVTNPIIYGVLNSRFRGECLHVFRHVASCGQR